ncbi:MAG: hypothetical protein JWN31_1879 [Frankiales bacterium]|nr:hypothetical protein [Frankiales bacterium]
MCKECGCEDQPQDGTTREGQSAPEPVPAASPTQPLSLSLSLSLSR